jgi:hypothetical protein
VNSSRFRWAIVAFVLFDDFASAAAFATPVNGKNFLKG